MHAIEKNAGEGVNTVGMLESTAQCQQTSVILRLFKRFDKINSIFHFN